MMITQEKDKKHTEPVYKENYDHLADELRKLDLLIKLRITASRVKNQAVKAAAVHHQPYISDEEVDWLLSQNDSDEFGHPQLQELRKRLEGLQSEIDARITHSIEQGVFLALPRLAHVFGLSSFELQALIICLAPELQRKYDTLYAYMQNDITRKKPSVDLVLGLLCNTQVERWNARTCFSGHAPMFRAGILETTDDPQSPSGSTDLARFLTLDPRVLNYLLGNNTLDERLVNIAKIYQPLPAMDPIPVDPAIKSQLLHVIRHHFSEHAADRKRLVLHFNGPYGVGKRDLALGICGQLSCPMLYLDMELLLAHEPDFTATLQLLFREGILLQAALYVDNVDVLLTEDVKARALIKILINVMAEYGWLTFLAGEKSWSLKTTCENMNVHAVKLPVPEIPLRETVWKQVLEVFMPDAEIEWARQLAIQFRLTPGQIRDAAELIHNRCALHNNQQELTLADFYSACRSQSNQKLGELAIKLEPHYNWEDIVLPNDKVAHLKEICSQVKHCYRVFGEWGFGRKLAHGKGLSVLFSGPPGTGKTMAAEIVAHELQLDLYKIDLSGVVSKYIGETERNLNRIFQEAETSNAILFFDEADALFGKRTEISDAHDRYANIEISYLLQKMEEYEGVVILASNLKKNMDTAFIRRMRFIVEFPFPDAVSRQEIWKRHFPEEAPLDEKIDYIYLAKQFQIAGGNIKNIVLNSAFLAAQDGGIIGMEHILRGTRREFEKMGKLWHEKKVMS